MFACTAFGFSSSRVAALYELRIRIVCGQSLCGICIADASESGGITALKGPALRRLRCSCFASAYAVDNTNILQCASACRMRPCAAAQDMARGILPGYAEGCMDSIYFSRTYHSTQITVPITQIITHTQSHVLILDMARSSRAAAVCSRGCRCAGMMFVPWRVLNMCICMDASRSEGCALQRIQRCYSGGD